MVHISGHELVWRHPLWPPAYVPYSQSDLAKREPDLQETPGCRIIGHYRLRKRGIPKRTVTSRPQAHPHKKTAFAKGESGFFYLFKSITG